MKTAKKEAPSLLKKDFKDMTLGELAEVLVGYVLFHKTTNEEREWINNASSNVAIELKRRDEAALEEEEAEPAMALKELRVFVMKEVEKDEESVYMGNMEWSAGTKGQSRFRIILEKLDAETRRKEESE